MNRVDQPTADDVILDLLIDGVEPTHENLVVAIAAYPQHRDALVAFFANLAVQTALKDEPAPSGCTMSNDELREHLVERDGGWCVVIAEPTPTVDADGLRPIKGTGAYKDVPLKRRSDEAGAVNWAWGVFDELYEQDPTTKRKDYIAAAVEEGIAFYTARTQYQKWLHRNDPKPEGE